MRKPFRFILGGVAFGLLLASTGCGKKPDAHPVVVAPPATQPVEAKPAPAAPKFTPEASANAESEKAIALINQLGGKYEEDPNVLGKPLVRLNLAGTKVNATGMLQLKSLTTLRHLDLAGTRIGDEGLEAVREMKDLTHLHLWSCGGITDKGFEHMQGLTKMEWMGVGNTGNNITGSGLVHLKGMKNLKFLAIDIIRKLEDRHLEHLSGLTNLEELRLNYDELVTDAGLKHIQNLPQLKALGLMKTRITDAGLGSLPELESLSLQETQITDAGLEKLRGMKQLKEVGLAKTKVTDAGVAELQKARPELKITR